MIGKVKDSAGSMRRMVGEELKLAKKKISTPGKKDAFDFVCVPPEESK